MEAFSHSTPHTCHHCQKLVLYLSENDDSWQESPSDPKIRELKTAGWAPTQRVKNWLNQEFPEVPSLHSALLRDTIIFDFTLAEVRQAADECCGLCESILGGSDVHTCQSSPLAARISDDTIYFGIPEREKPREELQGSPGGNDEMEEIMVRPFNPEFRFDLIALPSKLVKIWD